MSMHLSDLSLVDRVLNRLLEETQIAIEAGDLPVGSVLTVGDTLLASHRNTIRSENGQRFHAERNLLGLLSETAIPAGRRVFWVTLEPCLRCAQAIQRFGVNEVVYVLDDPFGGGKALLAEAGITLTQRGDWEYATLQRVMESFVRYPEFCAGRLFPFFLDAMQRYNPLGRDEQVKAVFQHHLAPYLPNVSAARQEEVRRSFLSHVDYLARLTQGECAGVPSIAFIRNLHRALFPPDYRHRAVGNDGVHIETASGEWRRHVLWPHYTEFSAYSTIEADLSALLNSLSTKASWRREDALQFIFDFWAIHPFTDANGRVASILADMICLNHGLAPLALDRKNELFYTALMENLSCGVPITEQLHLVDAWNRGQVGIRPRSIYDDYPSTFKTYVRRSGDKQYVVEQVLAKLADQRLNQPFVVTDVGAGTGIIADGILHSLLRCESTVFEYHYLEPSQVSVEYFREHSRYASLPQVVFHTMPVEDYLLPPSDLIVVVQTMQCVPNLGETLRDIVSALKPNGLALIVLSHPDSDEWRMVKRLTHGSAGYEHLKGFLDQERMDYEEIVVESLVRISPTDRDTPEGEDLLTFYFKSPASTLLAATKEAFWEGLSDFAMDGAVSKKDAFFWIGCEVGGGDDSMDCTLPPEARHYWNLRYAAFPRWDDGIQTDWQGLYSLKPEVLALQLAASLPGKVVLDGFCGIGGCAIAFARSGKKVLAVEIDERRLEMARNNARVYGVEDRITFIHGDVTELIGSLHYDVAYFDPPWGGSECHKKVVFGWDDFPVNPLPLIHAALALCETVALSVPVNFNVADLRVDDYELVLQHAKMEHQLWFLNAFYRKS